MRYWVRSSGRAALTPAAARPWIEADQTLGRALDLFGKRHLEQAEAVGREGLTIDPMNAELYHCLGSVLRARGRLEDAGAMLEVARNLSPRNPRIINDLGLVRDAQGRLHEASLLFSTARTLPGGSIAAHLNYANALAKLHRTRAALEVFQTQIGRAHV